MTEWKNLDTLDSFKKLKGLQNAVDLKSEMSGENGANRVRQYSVKWLQE